jgi:hypothetical protein
MSVKIVVSTKIRLNAVAKVIKMNLSIVLKFRVGRIIVKDLRRNVKCHKGFNIYVASHT